jgi:hypothetical protein
MLNRLGLYVKHTIGPFRVTLPPGQYTAQVESVNVSLLDLSDDDPKNFTAPQGVSSSGRFLIQGIALS